MKILIFITSQKLKHALLTSPGALPARLLNFNLIRNTHSPVNDTR